jgi:uncharacterized membrane protein
MRMPDYERTVTVGTDAEKAYEFLSDPNSLPRYVATMVMATAQRGDRLRVAADVEGRHEEGDAMFRTDASQRRVEWGAEDGSSYRGWLQIIPVGNRSTVHLHLSVPEAGDERQINEALDQTMGNIERILGTA